MDAFVSAGEVYGMKKNVLFMDDCNYTLFALSHLLDLRRFNSFRTGLNFYQMSKIVREHIPAAIVVNLRSTLTRQLSTLCLLATICDTQDFRGRIILLTDMSPVCARALLHIAGLPARLGGNFFTMSSRIPLYELQQMLSMVIDGNASLKAVGQYELNLTPLRLLSLKLMAQGLHERHQARRLNTPIKHVYNQRNAVIRKIGVSSQHALLCGVFLRRVPDCQHDEAE